MISKCTGGQLPSPPPWGELPPQRTRVFLCLLHFWKAQKRFGSDEDRIAVVVVMLGVKTSQATSLL